MVVDYFAPGVRLERGAGGDAGRWASWVAEDGRVHPMQLFEVRV